MLGEVENYLEESKSNKNVWERDYWEKFCKRRGGSIKWYQEI